MWIFIFSLYQYSLRIPSLLCCSFSLLFFPRYTKLFQVSTLSVEWGLGTRGLRIIAAFWSFIPVEVNCNRSCAVIWWTLFQLPLARHRITCHLWSEHFFSPTQHLYSTLPRPHKWPDWFLVPKVAVFWNLCKTYFQIWFFIIWIVWKRSSC